MSQSTQGQSLKLLSELTRQLAQVVDLSPIESMDQQLKQQQAQNDSNISWLDEASLLLKQVCDVGNTEQDTEQLIATIEQFIAKSRQVETESLPISSKLDGIYIP